MSQDQTMTCHNCQRKNSWMRLRCHTCHNRLPTWYVVATVAIGVSIYGAFVLLENIF